MTTGLWGRRDSRLCLEKKTMVELHQQTQVLLSMQEVHSGEENTSTVQRVAMCSLHQKGVKKKKEK